jgi:hypothetical protein
VKGVALAGGLLAAVLAGCGASDGEGASWTARADRACAAAERRIAHRGAPLDLRDVDRVTVRGIADVHALFDRIKRLPLPETGRARPRAVVEAIDRLEPHLDAFSRASDDGSAAVMSDALKPARDAYDSLSRAAGAARLHECFTRRDGAAVFDPLLSPVYSALLEEALGQQDRQVALIARVRPPHHPHQLDEFYAERSRIYAAARDRLEALMPPARVQRDAERLIGVVFNLEGDGTNPSFDAGELDHVTDAYIARYERRYRKLRREERRARRALRAALQRPPAEAAPPGADPSATPA